MEREKGVTTAPCYSCGNAVLTTERPDGSRAAVDCGCRTKAEVTPQVVLDPPVAVVRETGIVGEQDLLPANLGDKKDEK